MPRIVYKTMRLSAERRAIIEQADQLIYTYQRQGYTLTLRQLYYQFVAQDLFPDSWREKNAAGEAVGTKNTQQNYKKLGDVISDGRMCGLLDWEAIEDRTRELAAVAHWTSPADILDNAARAFHVDKWSTQPKRVEVWIEKDALEGIANQAAHALDTAVFSCRGYSSMSSLWAAARRLKEYLLCGQRPVLLHLGDHDPSGLDMTRDIRERLNAFLMVDLAREACGGLDPEDEARVLAGEVNGNIVAAIASLIRQEDESMVWDRELVAVQRIALTREQVRRYNPPPNPAKETDARFAQYKAQHGTESWELDALEPSVLAGLIQREIREHLESAIYDTRLAEEKGHVRDLAKAAAHWNSGLADHIATLDLPDEEKARKKGRKKP